MAKINIDIKAQSKAMEDMGKILRANLMDDFYMRRFFDGNVDCIQYVLRVIMKDNGLVVKYVRTQKHLKGSKHDVCLDIYAVSSEGEEYDIEVQHSDEEATPERAFYNLAMLKMNMLEKSIRIPIYVRRSLFLLQSMTYWEMVCLYIQLNSK